VIYVLLCGYLPYNINNRETLPANTNLAALFHVHFSEKSWKTISAAAKNLIKALLEPNQKLRLSADRLLQHPWVKNDALKTPQMVLDSPQVLRRTLGKPQVSPRVISARLADRVREQERKDVVDHSQIALALQLPHERRV
jgi:serine/threonine protein kinase